MKEREPFAEKQHLLLRKYHSAAEFKIITVFIASVFFFVLNVTALLFWHSLQIFELKYN